MAGIHTVFQSFGISLLINAKNTSDSIRSTEKHERWFFRFILGGTIIADFIVFFFSAYTTLYDVVAYGFTVLTALYYIGFCYYYQVKTGSKNQNKALFLARVILFPLSYLSIMAWVGFMSIHGLEYISITMRAEKDSVDRGHKISPIRNILSVLYVVTFVAFVMFGHLIPHDDRLHSPVSFWIFQTMGAYVFATLYLHYYVEGVIYKMRFKESRKHILPAIIG
jgi:hypothetical protein